MSDKNEKVEESVESTPCVNLLWNRMKKWQWIPTSRNSLVEAEHQVFKAIGVKSLVKSSRVPVLEGRCNLWTTVYQQNKDATSEKIPLVLIHGFAWGSAVWVLNLDALSQHRVVYAIDLLGFAQSSHPKFSKNPTDIENEWVQSIEDFRREMNIEKMILVGHSLGGFLTSAYALQHPDRVRHLVLVDPWGYLPKSSENDQYVQLPTSMKVVDQLNKLFNPLSFLRVAGPLGLPIVRQFCPEVGQKLRTQGQYSPVFDYFYHCNAQPPSGEVAFKHLSNSGIGFVKRPLIDRMSRIKLDLPMTFLFGSRPWFGKSYAYEMQHILRPESFVQIENINDAGHNVHSDQPDEFNRIINRVGELVDNNRDQPEHKIKQVAQIE